MANSIFDFVADGLETHTNLQTLEARGTLRLALKQAGLDARSVTAAQIRVVLAQRMPSELAARGVDRPDAACASIIAALDRNPPAESEPDPHAPEAIFRRLARR